MIVLDTHVAIWIATNDEALGRESRTMIERILAQSAVAISAISFWEIALLIGKGRYESPRAPKELRDQLLDSGVNELPLTGDIGILAVALDDLHGDPADRFIAATAIAHGATLVTADAKLLSWSHQLPRQNATQ